MTIFQHVVMQVDGQLFAVGDDGIEMETVREPADNVKLIVARIPGIYTGGGSGFGVAVCDMLCPI